MQFYMVLSVKLKWAYLPLRAVLNLLLKCDGNMCSLCRPRTHSLIVISTDITILKLFYLPEVYFLC